MMSEGFLKRWSRRKIELETSDANSPDETGNSVDAAKFIQNPDESAHRDQPLPVTMEDVEKIDKFAPDFSAFMKPGVDPAVQQAALKKMFSDPHFNVMDRLDIYIDDYSQPDPLPLEALKRMVQSDMLKLFRKEEVSKPADDVQASNLSPVSEETLTSNPALPLGEEGESSIADDAIKTIHKEE
jgi:Protein of unknown function (DUF3306)